MTIPARALLPYPLPENVDAFPMSLDRLSLRLGDGEVRVHSEATQASAPFAEAVAMRGLRLDEAGPYEVPVTASEAAVLAGLADLVADWESAQEDCDLHGLVSVQARLRKRAVPWWLDVRFEMPSRRPLDAIARFA